MNILKPILLLLTFVKTVWPYIDKMLALYTAGHLTVNLSMKSCRLTPQNLHNNNNNDNILGTVSTCTNCIREGLNIYVILTIRQYNCKFI